jgi:sulfur carrier protein
VIIVNGEQVQGGSGETVAEVLEGMGIGERAKGVAVAVDGQVVTRTRWREVTLSEGARVEVVTAMQGG